jgi:bacterioferritin
MFAAGLFCVDVDRKRKFTVLGFPESVTPIMRSSPACPSFAQVSSGEQCVHGWQSKWHRIDSFVIKPQRQPLARSRSFTLLSSRLWRWRHYQYWLDAKVVKGPMKEAVIAELLRPMSCAMPTWSQERIIQLGGSPMTEPKKWYEVTSCGYDAPDDPFVEAILNRNIKGERGGIGFYKRILEATGKDPVTYNIVLQISHDEVGRAEPAEPHNRAGARGTADSAALQAAARCSSGCRVDALSSSSLGHIAINMKSSPPAIRPPPSPRVTVARIIMPLSVSDW